MDEITEQYNEAYHKLVHCADADYEQAEKNLAYWRHLFFNS
jgi:hypothetical protein